MTYQPGETKTQLLDAAETLFAQKGIEGTSLREITHTAGANLAAVNYHFGSKDGLVRALFSRRLGPISKERLRLLDEALERKNLKLRNLVDAFVTPVVDMFVADPSGGKNFAQLIGRSFSQPRPSIAPIMEKELGETIRRFLAAFHDVLPALDEPELMWRFHFSVGAINHLLACGHILDMLSEGRCDLRDRDGIRQRLIDFIVGGMESSSTPDPSKQRSTR